MQINLSVLCSILVAANVGIAAPVAAPLAKPVPTPEAAPGWGAAVPVVTTAVKKVAKPVAKYLWNNKETIIGGAIGSTAYDYFNDDDDNYKKEQGASQPPNNVDIQVAPKVSSDTSADPPFSPSVYESPRPIRNRITSEVEGDSNITPEQLNRLNEITREKFLDN